jgi:hypothetical protein
MVVSVFDGRMCEKANVHKEQYACVNSSLTNAQLFHFLHIQQQILVRLTYFLGPCVRVVKA